MEGGREGQMEKYGLDQVVYDVNNGMEVEREAIYMYVHCTVVSTL